MEHALQIHLAADEAETITTEIWETAPSAEIMLNMLWESIGLRLDFPQDWQFAKHESHLHLFAAWTARRVIHLLIDPRSRNAIQTAEHFATGAATRLEMHQAHLQAETVVVELAETYKETDLPTTTILNPKENLSQEPKSVNTRTLFGAAVLHAASAASMACYAQAYLGGLQSAEACATYSRKAFYWKLLTDGADTVLITEFLEEEDRRQAQALRIFLGNPFSQNQSPAMALPCQHPLSPLYDYYSAKTTELQTNTKSS